MNGDAVSQLQNVKSAEDACKVFKQYGLDITVAEADDIIGSMVALAAEPKDEEAELNEAELVGVSGGGLWSIANNTWQIGTAIAGLYWGSQANAKKATISFWGNVVTRGWGYAARNVGRY